jgi:O-antigen biosynthesis protein
MSLFLTKIGKVYKTIRKNGIFAGGKIVIMYIGIFFKNILTLKKGDILIITGGVGDSAFYRAKNQAEELNLHGLKCASTIVEDPFLSKCAYKFKIFIFHRTHYTPKIARLVEEIKNQEKEIIFDTDDLVFDAKLFHETDSYKTMNPLERRQYEKGVGEEIISDPYVRICTTTTSYLAEKIKEKDKQVFVSKNKLSDHELEIADEILKKKEKARDGKIRIGYFSGTLSHNQDFSMITPVLKVILNKYPQAELYLAGYLEPSHSLNMFGSRIHILPYVPRDKYYENIWKVDINLAPLVKDDPFCESKSELKFFEPGILKVPTVAIRNQTFSEAITDGVDGFLADGPDEWIEKLGKLIENENLRKTMGENAREKVLKDYTNKNSHNEEYYKYLQSKL